MTHMTHKWPRPKIPRKIPPLKLWVMWAIDF